MRIHPAGRNSCRPAAVSVLTAFLMVFLMIVVAFAVDLGYIIVVHIQLQNAADAAAMAGTSKLLDQSLLTTSPNQSQAIANADAEAQRFSLANTAGGVHLQLANNTSNNPSGDLVCGYLSNPSDLSQQMDFTRWPNSVAVRVRRDQVTNGSLSLFFARIMGINSEDLTATATATYKDRVTGFSIHTPGHSTCALLPFTLNVNTWNQVLTGVGPDNFARDPSTGAVTSGSDGIHECKLFPLSNGGGNTAVTPGNFGTLQIGPANNSTATLVRQILYGPNADDLSYYPNGLIQLDPTTGTLILPGNTGVSAAVKDALTSIIGQPRVLPLYTTVSGNGANAQYVIVAFVGVTVLEAVLSGSLSSKHVTIEPCFCVDANAVTGNTVTTPSYYVYTPVALTR
jgi:Flp pilus assembly protein TadG